MYADEVHIYYLDEPRTQYPADGWEIYIRYRLYNWTLLLNPSVQTVASLIGLDGADATLLTQHVGSQLFVITMALSMEPRADVGRRKVTLRHWFSARKVQLTNYVAPWKGRTITRIRYDATPSGPR